MPVTGVLIRIESYIPDLRRCAYALLGSRQDADDLVQDSLLRALGKPQTHRDDADMQAWLFAIMHSLFISHLRRIGARPDSERLDETHEAVMSICPDQENNLQCRDLVRDLKRLPAEQRTAVLLVSVEDLSYAEVASVLRVPIGTVMSRLSRGRARLREIIKNEEVGAPSARYNAQLGWVGSASSSA